MKKNKRCNGHRLQLEPAAKRKEKQKVQQLATCNRRSRTANSTGPQVRRHRRQGLLWPQLEPDKRTKAQWLATCSRRTRTASSTHTSSSLHPFEHRSAVTPIRGGLQLRGSKWHRQLKTAKTPRNQTKSQGGGNLATFPGRSPGKAAPLRILAAAFFGCCALTLFLQSRRRWKSFEVRSGPCDPDTPKFDETGANAKTVPMVPWLNRRLLGACCWAPGPR